MGGTLLVVVIFPRNDVLFLLLLLSYAGADRNLAGYSFEFSVLKNLQPANLFLLYSPLLFLFFSSLNCSFFCLNLTSTLVQDRLLLLFVESFKVIGFHSVGSEHRLFGSGVLCHKIVVQRVVEFNIGIPLKVLTGFDISVALFLCNLLVSHLVGDNHGFAVGSVFLLNILKYASVRSLELKTRLLDLSSFFLYLFFLSYLLFDPVLLL